MVGQLFAVSVDSTGACYCLAGRRVSLGCRGGASFPTTTQATALARSTGPAIVTGANNAAYIKGLQWVDTPDRLFQALLEETIRRNGGSVTKASRVLELSPSTLYRKLEQWGLKP